MRIVVTGGGTGGHIYPALSIIKELKKHRAIDVLYMGSERGMERDLVQKAGYPFFAIEIRGLNRKRKFSLENLLTLWRFVAETGRIKRRLRSFRPSVVIGTGGYVSAPVVFAAARLGIPTLIHEQNVVPGLTNQILSRFADVTAVSFSASIPHFKKAKKVVLTGNPRATEVVRASAEEGLNSLGFPRGKRLVLVYGGSRGAWPIVQAFLEAMPRLSENRETGFVLQTGQVNYERVMGAISGAPPGNVRILAYIDNMPQVLAAASLVVSRAGASTLAELTALGIPAILIPSPYVTNNHQEKNARMLEKRGAARVILEWELTGERLCAEIEGLLDSAPLLEKMGIASRALGEPMAAQKVAEEILRLVN